MLKETRKAWWKVLKKQLQGSRKPARGTKGEVEAFDCDKSANLMPKNVEKVEIWPKRHLKCERTRVWKCKTTVYGIAPNVVDPQDTIATFVADSDSLELIQCEKFVIFGIFGQRKCINRKHPERSLFEESGFERSHFRF